MNPKMDNASNKATSKVLFQQKSQFTLPSKLHVAAEIIIKWMKEIMMQAILLHVRPRFTSFHIKSTEKFFSRAATEMKFLSASLAACQLLIKVQDTSDYCLLAVIFMPSDMKNRVYVWPRRTSKAEIDKNAKWREKRQNLSSSSPRDSMDDKKLRNGTASHRGA